MRGKMVFIPHGTDQMFHQPQGSLFPDLKGLVARAVLETGAGRARFRERCAVLFTNLFPGLTNRVEQLRQRLRPVVTSRGANAEEAGRQAGRLSYVEHDRAVAELKQRIAERLEHLRKELLAPPPQPIQFRPGGEVVPSDWLPCVEQGTARLHEMTNASGLKVLLARLEPNDKTAVGLWQTRVFLSKGLYRLTASVTAEQPIFRGPTSPVTLKLWGGVEAGSESNRPDAQHLDLAYHFETRSEIPEEVLIQCVFRSSDATVAFQLGPVTLTRVE
jgi:hypothetical protein